MNKERLRFLVLGLIFLAALILSTFFSAPSNKIDVGSTYNKTAEGYGAWYAFMEARGSSITRWKKPHASLLKQPSSKPITLVKINNSESYYAPSSEELDWLRKGNRLVIIGLKYPTTNAPFSSQIQTDEGKIKIETTRRNSIQKQAILSDNFGAIIWQEKIGLGELIYCISHDFAANAYQEYPNNYEFLAQIVSRNNNPIFIDEYLHGYRDEETIKKEAKNTLGQYLLQQPLSMIILQLGIIGSILFLANLRRFGKPLTTESASIDNNTAYIEALAGILRQANSNNFVVRTIGKESQIQLQNRLGLDNTLLDRQNLINLWVERTGKSTEELEKLLAFDPKNRSIDNLEMIQWLETWENILKSVRL
jgi:hypothetical protein